MQEYYHQPKSRSYVFGDNLIQFLFATWLNPLFNLASKRQLEHNDIPDLSDKEKSQLNFSKFKKIFEEQSSNNLSSYQGLTLFKSIVKFYKSQSFVFLFLCLLSVGLQIILAIFNSIFISYIQKDHRTTINNIKYFIVYIILCILHIASRHIFYYIKDMKGINLSNCLQLMISDKALHFPFISSKQFNSSEVINYSQIDAKTLQYFGLYTKQIFCSIFHIIFSFILIYIQIGMSCFIGFGVLFIFIVLLFILFEKLLLVSQQLSQANDNTLKIAEQILDIIKFIKVNTLEEYFLKKIHIKRQQQMSIKLKLWLYNSLNKFVSLLCSPLLIASSLFTYIFLGNQLSTPKAFFVIMLYNNIQEYIHCFPENVTWFTKSWVSCQRIQRFLLAEEIDDGVVQFVSKPQGQNAIQVYNGNFLYEKLLENIEHQQAVENNQIYQDSPFIQQFDNQGGTEITINNRKYIKVLKDINLNLIAHNLTIIIGEIGSGKSSLTYSLLNQLKAQPGKNSKIIINGSISYCSQKPWIKNGSIKHNIILFNQFSQEKFDKAVYYSCLEEDIKTLQNGFDTQIGEKGVNLSGGQKARVSLARALYFNSDIYIFDDILSAVDVYVGRFLMEKTIKGYLKGKTIILITHSLFEINKADNLIFLNKGSIIPTKSSIAQKFMGEYSRQSKFVNQIQKSKQLIKQQPIIKGKVALGNQNKLQKINSYNQIIQQLTLPEDKQEGETSIGVYQSFYELLGGIVFICPLLLSYGLYTLFSTFQNIQIQKWCQDLKNSVIYFYLYLGFSFYSSIFIVISMGILIFGELNLSRKIYNILMKKLIYADYINFFIRVPKGRILNRLGKDFYDMSNITTTILQQLLYFLFSTLAGIAISAYVSTPFMLAIIPILLLIAFCLFKYYVKCQLQLTRLEKIYLSPVLSGIQELISCIDGIRSYKVQEPYLRNQAYNIDILKKISLTRLSLEYWFMLRLSIILFFLIFQHLHTVTLSLRQVDLEWDYS